MVPIKDKANASEWAPFMHEGTTYMFVCSVYKLNTQLLRTTKNREDEEMISAFKSCYNKLNLRDHHPTLHVLDRECSQAVKKYITS